MQRTSPQAKEYRLSLEDGEGKETDSTLGTPERTSPANTITSSAKQILEFWHPEL